MIVKSISHEQRKKAAAERRTMRANGQEPPLKRVSAKDQAAHVIGASRYFMRPTKLGEKALGIGGHRVHRTSDYLVGDKAGGAPGERLLYVAHQNFRTTTLAEQQAEMIALMSVEPGADDTFEHMVLSPGRGIVPSRHQMEHVPKRLLELLGTTSHLAFVVWHGDTGNVHGHIGVSRIEPETGKRVALGEGWLLDTLGQAIAQIEFEEGWQPEPGARYRANKRGVFLVATDEQVRDADWNRVGRPQSQKVKREQDEARGKVKLSTGAAEYERHQRLWSDERTAQLIAWPIIRDAGSWDKLHRGLAAEGIRYEKEGSGAKLFVGDRDMKATTANWAASIKKLARLGAFEPRAEDVEIAPLLPRQLDGAEQRAAHKAAKAQAAAEKEAERADIARAASDALVALSREHDRLQQLINDANWAGRADQLELARKLAGAVHRDAREAVEVNRRDADRAARAMYRFPGFETWLREGFLSEDEDEGPAERRKRAPPGIILGADGRHNRHAVLLPGYMVDEDDLERRYLRDGRVRFVDRGNRIEVADVLDRASVRDALLVASARWDSVQITGDRRFRELAADIAAELDIRISNPELQMRIACAQGRRREVRETEARSNERLRARAEMLIAQWPLLREQEGKVVAGKVMREQHRVSVEDMLQPVFQAALRSQLERQRRVLKHMGGLVSTRPNAFRTLSGRLTLPDRNDPADIVRRQNWLADAGFVKGLEDALSRAEATRRTELAARAANVVRMPEAEEQAAPGQEARARPAPTATRGWNGITLKPDQRLRLLAAARARLAAQDWNPADYPLHADPRGRTVGRDATAGDRSASLPAAAGNMIRPALALGSTTRTGTRASAIAAQDRSR